LLLVVIPIDDTTVVIDVIDIIDGVVGADLLRVLLTTELLLLVRQKCITIDSNRLMSPQSETSLCPQCSRRSVIGLFTTITIMVVMLQDTWTNHYHHSFTRWFRSLTGHQPHTVCVSSTWSHAQSNNCTCPIGFFGPFGGPCSGPCSAAHYSIGSPQLKCLPCAAGTYQTDPGQGRCEICPAGSYCPAASKYPRACDNMLYSAPGATAAIECQCSCDYYRSDATWSYQCLQSCPILPQPRYGTVQQNGTAIGSSATFTCNHGYHISPVAIAAVAAAATIYDGHDRHDHDPVITSLTITCSTRATNNMQWPLLPQPLCIADASTKQSRVLVLYNYHGDNTKEEGTNLEFFILQGMLQYVNDTSITFVIVVPHHLYHQHQQQVPSTLRLPTDATNIHVIALDCGTHRSSINNICMPHILLDLLHDTNQKNHYDIDISDYNYIITIPSTSRGPFMPRYVTDYWIDHLLSLMTSHDSNQRHGILTTSLICTNGHHHHTTSNTDARAKSPIMISSEYMYMIDTRIWQLISRREACCDTDIDTYYHDITNVILDHGYNIVTLSTLWHGFDFIHVIPFHSVTPIALMMNGYI
jgi:hypothetical protein